MDEEVTVVSKETTVLCGGEVKHKIGVVSLWRRASILTSAFNILIVVIDQPRGQYQIFMPHFVETKSKYWEPLAYTTTKSKKIKKKTIDGIYTSYLFFDVKSWWH